MWLITTQGFYSAVEHRDDPDVLIIRARALEDIEALRVQVPSIEPFEDPTADYRWRAFVKRAEWVEAVGKLAAEVDYPNFKNAVAERQGRGRAFVYSKVWQVLLELRSRTSQRSEVSGRRRIVLDQDAFQRAQPVPVQQPPETGSDPDAISAQLKLGPVVLEGPGDGWCIQAVCGTGGTRIEILDPVHWGNGPALPENHLAVATELGFEAGEGMWVTGVAGLDESDLTSAGRLMRSFIDQAWEGRTV